jgi:transcriptional regulator with XRE-family HTH domain
MYLDKNMIDQLKIQSSIGPRIRIIREFLKSKFGNYFSGNSVANRIEGLTQSNLTMIERGKVKSVSAETLYSLAKEFGVSYEVFFNDFYLQSNPEIKISPPHIKESNFKKDQKENVPFSNPLDESEFRLNIKVSKVASNGDYQIILYRDTIESHEYSNMLNFIAQVIHCLYSLDALKNKELISNASYPNPFKVAQDLLDNSFQNVLVFPWHSGALKDQKENEEYENAINYTQELINLKKSKEDKIHE